MNRQHLEAQADQLQALLHQPNRPVQVTGGNVTPRWVQFLVIDTTEPHVQRFAREIATLLHVSDVRVSARGDVVRIDVPRSDPQPLRLLDICRRIPPQRIPANTAVLGIADDGAPLLTRLPAGSVRDVLIAGTTGAGKTSLLHSIGYSLALINPRRTLQLALIGDGLHPLSGLPHLLQPFNPRPDALLNQLVGLLKSRQQQNSSTPLIVVLIDELDHLTDFQLTQVIQLVQLGWPLGLIVVAATAKPSSPRLHHTVLQSWPVRIVGRTASVEDALVASQQIDSGAERLSGTGDFLAASELGLIRFAGAYISLNELQDGSAAIASGQTYTDWHSRQAPTARPRSSAGNALLFQG